MSTTAQPPARLAPDALTAAAQRQSVWKHGVAAAVIAAVMARRARRPRLTFARTAVALTAVSFTPDLTLGFDAGSASTLITLHAVAAAIMVPTLAKRLARMRLLSGA